MTGCGPGSDGATLSELQLIGVDFELNSMILTNNSSQEVLTDGLWAYRDGESFEFNIFPIEPRATILFSMRDLGEIDVANGEIALAEDGGFDDPESLLQYVRWGDATETLAPLATEAGLWPEGETVETREDTLVLIRTDATGTGAASWEASSEAP